MASREDFWQVDEDGYKYPDLLGKKDICRKEMKEHDQEKYFKILKTTLKSELNAKNIFRNGLLTQDEVAIVRSTAGIIERQKSSWKRLIKMIGRPSQ